MSEQTFLGPPTPLLHNVGELIRELQKYPPQVHFMLFTKLSTDPREIDNARVDLLGTDPAYIAITEYVEDWTLLAKSS
jgi:hypothetical protein